MATGLRRGRTAAFGADLWIDSSGNATVTGGLTVSGATTFTGAITVPNGLLTACAVAVDGNPDTGIYFGEDNQMNLAANGVAVLDILSTGVAQVTASGASAGSDSNILRLRSITSAAARIIDIISEADAGTDTYRLRINNNAGTAMATLESDGTLTTTGVHVAPVGSSSACSYVGAGGLNNGMYFGSTTQVNFAAGGVNVLDLINTGVVQVTASGSSNGDDSNVLRFRFKTNGSFRIMDLQGEADAGADTYRLRFNDNAGAMMAAIDSRRWLLLDEADSNPTTAELDADDSGAVYFKGNKIVFAVNVGGTVQFLSAPIDNATTTWSVGAP